MQLRSQVPHEARRVAAALQVHVLHHVALQVAVVEVLGHVVVLPLVLALGTVQQLRRRLPLLVVARAPQTRVQSIERGAMAGEAESSAQAVLRGAPAPPRALEAGLQDDDGDELPHDDVGRGDELECAKHQAQHPPEQQRRRAADAGLPRVGHKPGGVDTAAPVEGLEAPHPQHDARHEARQRHGLLNQEASDPDHHAPRT
mmetsp:Transcript_24776/g.86263  ORF Transcript_24776/g.86263 Transcript_24776/m.86263 type:complete len:201 (+) Transcript_24776:1731-2333(+)